VDPEAYTSRRSLLQCRRVRVAIALVLVLLPAVAAAQPGLDPSEWKQLSIEELLDIDITTAARRPDPIRTTAAPVQVLTRDDLHRAGVRYLAEAFRLADALYVGRFDGRTWIVNARGLAINGANKMQVLIDGRSIYSPLYSGIFWDAQDLIIDDIDRIEIIRGPGASLWGANAVHGIINVITRRAVDSQGLLAVVGGGNEERVLADLRGGGRHGDRAHYRAYAKYHFRDAQALAGGASADDPMQRGQVGGRYDWQPNERVDVTVQGDAYAGRLGLLGASDTTISGGNVLARWLRRSTFGATQVQAYYDRVRREVPGQIGERRNTVDLDVQQTWSASRHVVVAGGGYRASGDDTDVTPIVSFEPSARTTHLVNVFAQDEVSLGRGLFAIGGVKVERNTYSDWEVQPTGRLRWTRGRQTAWGAVSRAVRLPTRFDSDIRFTGGTDSLLVTGSAAFRPEAMVAYEAGWRSQPLARVSFEVATYRNTYDDLRSQDRLEGAPITIGNGVAGHISGLEVGTTWTPSAAVRVHGSYAYLRRAIGTAPGSADITGGEGNDAPHLATLQVFGDLAPDLRLNVMTRYVAALPRPRVDGYVEADVTLQWDVASWAELGLVGQNLLQPRHPEFSSGQAFVEEYERSLYVTLTIRRR
jgi:iron complex outermembrane receptor protein